MFIQGRYPQFSVADVNNGWVEALRNLGEQVYTFNLDDRLAFYDRAMVEVEDYQDEHGNPAFRKALARDQAVQLAANGVLSACYQAWPEVILMVSAFFTPPHLLEMMRGRGHKIVMLFTEAPYQTDQQLEMAKYADLVLLNDPTGIEQYEALAPAVYMPHAYREHVHYPDPAVAKKWDLSFIGTGFPSRVRFFKDMDLTGLDVRLGGVWMDLPEDSPLRDWTDFHPDGCVDNVETARIYRQSRAGINFYRRESEPGHAGEGWACGPREIEMAACQLWFARDGRPESDELFGMLPAFTDAREAGEMIRWALAHPDDAQEAAGKARAAIQDRTFGNHARKLLAMLNN